MILDASIIIALVALVVAWDLHRKTTRHLIRVTDVSASIHTTATYPAGFVTFDLYLKNIGLPVPKMTVILRFRKNDGYGTFRMRLRAVSSVDESTSSSAEGVATGLVVWFGWRSSEMNPNEIQCLKTLIDPRKQHAALDVYCAGYRIKTIRMETGTERAVRRWRNAVWRIGKALRLGPWAGNQNSWRAALALPDCSTLSSHLMHFISMLKSP